MTGPGLPVVVCHRCSTQASAASEARPDETGGHAEDGGVRDVPLEDAESQHRSFHSLVFQVKGPGCLLPNFKMLDLCLIRKEVTRTRSIDWDLLFD